MIFKDALGSPLHIPQEGDSYTPRPGDSWVVSIDGRDRGLVLIAHARDMHVLAWPLTMPSLQASWPSFRANIPGMGPMVVWPDAEFGLSTAALDRRLGNVLDNRTIRVVQWSVTEEGTTSEVDWCPMIESTEADDAFENVCSQAWELGDWGWPSADPGIGVLDGPSLQEMAIDVETLAKAWATKPGRASALARGVKVPTETEIDTVVNLLPPSHAADDILAPVSGDDAQVISFPTYKHRVVELMNQMGTTEQRARTSLWERSGQAARQITHADPLDAARARVKFALNQLLEETN